jgi:hypothetical protein
MSLTLKTVKEYTNTLIYSKVVKIFFYSNQATRSVVDMIDAISIAVRRNRNKIKQCFQVALWEDKYVIGLLQ